MKKHLIISYIVILILALCGCNKETEEIATTEEVNTAISIEPYIATDVTIKGTTTNRTFYLQGLVSDATDQELILDVKADGAFGSDYNRYEIYSQGEKIDSISDYYAFLNTEYKQPDGLINSVKLQTDEYIVNDSLKVGMTVDEVKALYGEGELDDQGYVCYLDYKFTSEVFGDYKFHLKLDNETHSTVEEINIWLIDASGSSPFDRHVPIPRYIAEDYLLLYGTSITPPNSANGVNFALSFKNISDRTIKYITVIATPYNAVGDPVVSEVGNESTARFTLTGPIEPNATNELKEENAWYNADINYANIEAIEIIYMDAPDETVYFEVK